MSTYWKPLLLCAVALPSGSVAFADVSITNPDFSAVPVVCGGDYAYQIFGGNCASADPQQDFNSTAGFGWTFLSPGGNGLTKPNTGFNPPSFSGMPFRGSPGVATIGYLRVTTLACGLSASTRRLNSSQRWHSELPPFFHLRSFS